MPNLKLTIDYDEARIVDQMAAEDLRPPAQALRWLIRQEAERRGWATKSNGAGDVLDQSHPGATLNHDAPAIVRNGERHA